MLFQFPPAIQAGMDTGKYVQVFSNGTPLSIARDAATGHFVGNAVGMLDGDGSPIYSIIDSGSLITGGIQKDQMHRGFQSVQASLGVLQATTAVIGVGVAASVALSAVNLYQTLKLRKAVERLELQVENGFLNLKQALNDQSKEIIEHIDKVAHDIKFEQHRVILVRAYGLFIQALERLQSALRLQDVNRRNAEIDAARGMLFEALADYTNPELLSEVCVAGQLRRLECSWAIEQTIIGTYQAQNELIAAEERLVNLQNKIRQKSASLVLECNITEELDFLFPEITRLHDQDLMILGSWQNHLTWMRSLPPSELKLLQSADSHDSTPWENQEQQLVTVLAEPEMELYEYLEYHSHGVAIRDQLAFLMNPQLRKEYEQYISQQALQEGYKVFKPSTVQRMSNFSLANFYYYFLIRDDTEQEEE